MKQIKVCFKDFMKAALIRAARTVAQTASLQNLYCKNETEADKLTTGTHIRTGVKVWVGKRGAPGTYLYKTT